MPILSTSSNIIFLPINSDKMMPMVKNISEKLITDVFEKDENFKFFKRKS